MDFLKNLITGTLAGFTVESILFPIDNIKTKLQSKQNFSFYRINTLYDGFLPAVVGSIPGSAVFFCFYEYTKRALRGNKDAPPSDAYVYIISSYVANLAATVMRVPFEVIKQQMQVTENCSIGNIVYDVFEKKGVCAYFIRSYLSMLIRDAPSDCIQFFLWETFQKIARQRHESWCDKFPTVVSAISGGLAGGISGFLTTPIDVIKSRQVLYKKSFIETFQDLQNEGILSFFKGCHVRSIYMLFGGTIFLGSLTFYSLLLQKTFF